LDSLELFHQRLRRLWRHSLTRRGNKRMSWARFMRRCDGYFPQPRTLHPYPYQRFAVTHPRWEPYARKAPVRFCAGGTVSDDRPYRDSLISLFLGNLLKIMVGLGRFELPTHGLGNSISIVNKAVMRQRRRILSMQVHESIGCTFPQFRNCSNRSNDKLLRECLGSRV
jgi:hypothetical protein